MSSKIKVDTIENVAGSGNVSLGSGHNLVVLAILLDKVRTAITSNATVGGTLGVTGASTLTGNLQMGGTSGVSSSRIVSTIATGNSLEWGHSNAAWLSLNSWCVNWWWSSIYCMVGPNMEQTQIHIEPEDLKVM